MDIVGIGVGQGWSTGPCCGLAGAGPGVGPGQVGEGRPWGGQTGNRVPSGLGGE